SKDPASPRGRVGSPAADLEAKQVADFRENSVPCPSEILESEFAWLVQGRAVPKVDKSPRDRAIAKKPVRREFIRGIARVQNTVHKNLVAVRITKWRARARGVLPNKP